jgi:ATP-dependent Lhr-like helicase
MLQMGPVGEQRYGRRHFLDLTAVFADPPTLAVVNGPITIGTVHVDALLRAHNEDGTQLLMAGRVWAVGEIDWKRRQVQVTPSSGRAATAWSGTGVGMSSAVAAAVRRVLAGEDPAGVRISERGQRCLDRVREPFGWLDAEGATHIVEDADGTTWWWTFAGSAANDELQLRLGNGIVAGGSSGLAIRLDDGRGRARIQALASSPADPEMPDDLEMAWKFVDALPSELVAAMWTARSRDDMAVAGALAASPFVHHLGGTGPRP